MRSFLRLFSFYGRSNRSTYWIFFLISIAVSIVLSIIFDLVLFRFNFGDIIGTMKKKSPAAMPVFDKLMDVPAGLVIAVGVVGAVLFVALMLGWIAVSVRRLHDMGATGWLVLVILVVNVFVPFGAYLLATLVLGSWPSSRGNRYGVGPRDERDVLSVFDDRRPAGTI